jgi:hypothetical protein
MLHVVADEQTRVELTTDLDELFREGARRMLAAALEQLIGAAAGLSASEATRLTTQWQVRAAARFEQGTLVERADRAVQDAAA